MCRQLFKSIDLLDSGKGWTFSTGDILQLSEDAGVSVVQGSIAYTETAGIPCRLSFSCQKDSLCQRTPTPRILPVTFHQLRRLLNQSPPSHRYLQPQIARKLRTRAPSVPAPAWRSAVSPARCYLSFSACSSWRFPRWFSPTQSETQNGRSRCRDLPLVFWL